MRGNEFSLYQYDSREHWFWDTKLFTVVMLWPLWLLIGAIIALAIRG